MLKKVGREGFVDEVGKRKSVVEGEVRVKLKEDRGRV